MWQRMSNNMQLNSLINEQDIGAIGDVQYNSKVPMASPVKLSGS